MQHVINILYDNNISNVFDEHYNDEYNAEAINYYFNIECVNDIIIARRIANQPKKNKLGKQFYLQDMQLAICLSEILNNKEEEVTSDYFNNFDTLECDYIGDIIYFNYDIYNDPELNNKKNRVIDDYFKVGRLIKSSYIFTIK